MRVALQPLASDGKLMTSTFSPGFHAAHFFLKPSTRRQLSSRALKLSQPSISRSRNPSLSIRNSNNPPTIPPSFFTPSLCRHASTSTSTAPEHTATAADPSTIPAALLDWNTFFKLRTSRRRYSLVSSIISSLGTTAGSMFAISTYPDVADGITKIVPLDAFTSMGIATFAATLLGWLIGPFFGNAVWRALHRTRLTEFIAKERAFFERIKKHRVDPRGASANNPVPDYYGEKVGSVQGYRRWLRDQRAFNRKRGGTAFA